MTAPEMTIACQLALNQLKVTGDSIANQGVTAIQ